MGRCFLAWACHGHQVPQAQAHMSPWLFHGTALLAGVALFLLIRKAR